MNNEDIKLIKRIKKKSSKSSANELISKYYKEIYTYTYKQTLEKELSMDLTQEIFISVLKSINNYDESKSSFRTWIYKIATNKLIDYYRSKSYKYNNIVVPIEDKDDFIKNIMNDSYATSENMYAFIFMISPVLYFTTVAFSYINMKEHNTYQVEMVCKYNIFQISSLRMLVFSIICILVNTVIIMIMAKKIIFIKGIMISISSLFLFSTIVLYSLLNIKNIILKYSVVLGWIALNGLFYIINVDIYNQVLLSIPTYIYGIVSLVSIYSYIKNIKKLSGYQKLNIEL